MYDSCASVECLLFFSLSVSYPGAYRAPWTLYYLKSSLAEVNTNVSFTWSSSWFNQVEFPCNWEVDFGPGLHNVTGEGIYSELLPGCLSWVQHVNVDLPTLGSCFSSYYTFSLGDLSVCVMNAYLTSTELSTCLLNRTHRHLNVVVPYAHQTHQV